MTKYANTIDSSDYFSYMRGQHGDKEYSDKQGHSGLFGLYHDYCHFNNQHVFYAALEGKMIKDFWTEDELNGEEEDLISEEV